MLPEIEDFKPIGGGQSPLSKVEEWVKYKDGIRETDVMPAVAGSSWYYLRYMDSSNDEELVGKERVNYWREVDLYVGGAEHAVAHLLYARFWHKFLYDLGMVPTKEPFRKLINQGMIQGTIEYLYLDKNSSHPKRFYSADAIDQIDEEQLSKIPVHIDFVQNYGDSESSSYLDNEGLVRFVNWIKEYKTAEFHNNSGKTWSLQNPQEDFLMLTVSEIGKMSKSLFNVINPDDVIQKYGTDCFRMYEMFLGPIEQSKPWDTNGIDGVFKFLRKFWNLFVSDEGKIELSDISPKKEDLKALHLLLKKLNHDIEDFSFNTCVSAFMICVNALQKSKCNNRENTGKLNKSYRALCSAHSRRALA